MLHFNVGALESLQVAFEAHHGQKRKSGEPYIIHPVEVARILGELVRTLLLKSWDIFAMLSMGMERSHWVGSHLYH